MHKETFLKYLTVSYVVLLILSNVMATRLVGVGPLVLDAGNLTYPLLFMVGDLMADVYGYKASRKIILTGFAFNFVFIAFTWLGTRMPAFDDSALTLGYDALFNYSGRIVLASFICYILGSLLNAGSLVWIKKLTGERLFAVRTIGSTAIGALLDTFLFSILAWAGQIPMRDILVMVGTTYAVKMAYEIFFATPTAYGLRRYMKNLTEE